MEPWKKLEKKETMCLYGGRDNFCLLRFSSSRLHIALFFCLFKSLRRDSFQINSSMIWMTSCGLLCSKGRKEERKPHLTYDAMSSASQENHGNKPSQASPACILLVTCLLSGTCSRLS